MIYTLTYDPRLQYIISIETDRETGLSIITKLANYGIDTSEHRHDNRESGTDTE